MTGEGNDGFSKLALGGTYQREGDRGITKSRGKRAVRSGNWLKSIHRRSRIFGCWGKPEFPKKVRLGRQVNKRLRDSCKSK